MRVVMLYHSLVSDWNHGNAHFLRGIAGELQVRGHEVQVYEPEDGWSARNLLQEYGTRALDDFAEAYPELKSMYYDARNPDLNEMLRGADLVLVHEWNPPELVNSIGAHHASNHRYRLLFHDTHHRALTEPQAMSEYNLAHYDGVLAFGRILRDIYLERGWASRAWTWHEAADTRKFFPSPGIREFDLIWIGNWGDEERASEIQEFLIEPVQALALRACIYGVRYPESVKKQLAAAGIVYGGWLPNYKVPETFAKARLTVHIPRRPYSAVLPGIPTIRVFEALACGIPLICAPWQDCERLFTPGRDYLCAANGREMTTHIRDLLAGEERALSLAAHGRRTILERHTCVHRVDRLLRIHAELAEAPHARVSVS